MSIDTYAQQRPLPPAAPVVTGHSTLGIALRPLLDRRLLAWPPLLLGGRCTSALLKARSVGALLAPLLEGLLVALAVRVFGSSLVALGVLGVLFIFMPGVLVIANYDRWPRWVRFLGCLAYVVLSEIVYVGAYAAVLIFGT